jgi:hypothetical protein
LQVEQLGDKKTHFNCLSVFEFEVTFIQKMCY